MLKKKESKYSGITEKVIDKYLESQDDDNEIKELAKDRVYSLIREDIFEREKKYFKKKFDTFQFEKQTRQVTELLFETILIGVLIGLFVNQITEVVQFLKGNNSGLNIMATGITSFVFFAAALLILILRSMIIVQDLIKDKHTTDSKLNEKFS